MSKRSEHTHEELRLVAILTGNHMIPEDGFLVFSVRKLAYWIGCNLVNIYNFFGAHECMIARTNGQTFDELAQFFNQ